MKLIKNNEIFFLTEKNYKKANTVFIGAAIDLSATYFKGSKNAPQKIINATNQIELELPFSNEVITEKALIFDEGIVLVKRKKELMKAFNLIEKKALNALKNKKLLMVLGGEHSINFPIAKALSKTINPKKTLVISFDAHLDLRNSYENNKFSHACAMKRFNDFGFKQVFIGQRDCISFEEQETIKEKNLADNIFYCATQPKKFYEKIKSKPWIKKENLVFDSNISVKQLKKILSKLNGIENLYISIDIDVLSAEFISTGTPMPCGLTFNALNELLFEILMHAKKKKVKLLGFDLVEVIPEKSNPKTETIAAMLAFNLLSWNFAYK